MSKSKVTVKAHPETGEVITINKKNPEFGTIRLDQAVVTMEGGFLNRANRSAFIIGKIENLKLMGYQAGQEIEGQIIRNESRTPMYVGHTAKLNPSTKKLHLVDGKPVYFKDSYTSDLSTKDSLIVAVATKVAVPSNESEATIN